MMRGCERGVCNSRRFSCHAPGSVQYTIRTDIDSHCFFFAVVCTYYTNNTISEQAVHLNTVVGCAML